MRNRLISAGLVLGVLIGTTQTASAITRCEVLRRAQAWVDDPNAWYSWDATYTDPTTGVCCYRPDCSGLVSASWGLPAPGHTTYSFAGGPWDDGVSYPIGAGDLKPGDALNYPGDPNQGTGHIMLYVSGTFSSGSVEVMEEYNTGHTAERRWRNIDPSIYHPIRYKNISDGDPEVCNGQDDDCDGQVDEGGVCCTPSPELCDGKDNDCNGQIDDGEICEQQIVWQGGAWLAPSRTTDVNGDGKADLCARGAAGLRCFISSGDGWKEDASYLIPLSNDSGWGAERFWSTFRMGDFDNNGKADFCARDSAGLKCWLSDGAKWRDVIVGPEYSDASGWGKTQYYSTIRLADINGDGKDDVCARAGAGLQCRLWTGSGFGAVIAGPDWSDAQGYAHPKFYGTLQMGDINGDGKADVCIRAGAGMDCRLSDGKGFPTKIAAPSFSDASGWGKPEYWSTIRLVDVDGDRKADICARSSASLFCQLSKGDSFGDPIQVAALSDASSWNSADNYLTLRVGRVTGNAGAELCLRSDSTVQCYRYVGGKFQSIDGPGWSNAAGWGDPKYYETLRIGDMNGDSYADLCARTASGFSCVLSTGTGFGKTVLLDEMTDKGGWGEEKYYGTILMGGPSCIAKAEICNGKDDNCDGQVDEGAVCEPADAGNDSGGIHDGGKIQDSSMGDSSLGDAGIVRSGDDAQGCSCNVRGGALDRKGLILVVGGLALLIQRLRNRRT